MKSNSPIRIAYNPDFAPFSHVVKGTPSGIILERIMDVFQAADIDYEFLPTKLVNLTADLMAGKIDALAALAITPARLKTLSFTKPMIISGGAWFTLANNDPLIDGGIPKSVITPKVGPLVGQIKNLFPEIDLKTSSDYDAALKAVVDGEVQAAALNWHVGRMLITD
ncbi:MAG: transporter substrate-binding domain-containing protein, partial [Kordiimonadaceae bacterium]|nr:transporter substrate-binding domain-containing protein [Kordiimonadaceae bacterium]